MSNEHVEAHPTVQDAVNYVLAHRRGKAFINWTPQEIASAIVQGCEDNTMTYALDSHTGALVGVMVGVKFESARTIYVSGILTTARGVLTKFIDIFKAFYPGWTLEAERHGKRVRYNTSKLVSKLGTKAI